jgi:effector-binding domain-containing protein
MAAEEKRNSNGNEVELRELEPQSILSIRGTIPTPQLGETMGERIAALRGYLQQSGARPAGPPFVRYHTFDETETDMEFGVPVAEPVAGEGHISAGDLPGGPAVTTSHRGAHDKLGEAYERITTWMEEHNREPSSPGWEVYHWIDLAADADPSTWDPSTWHTELVQPLK